MAVVAFGPVAGCGPGLSGPEKKYVCTAGQIEALEEVIGDLSEDHAAQLHEELAATASQPNGTNKVLLHFLNTHRHIDDTRLFERGRIGMVHFDGQLEFLDLWGRPLIVFPAGAAQIVCDLGERETAMARPDVEGEREVLIWSVGPNGVNEHGRADDIASWHR